MESDIRFCTPKPTDGMAVFELVKRCAPLDPNSSYCNLLQCTHFFDTSIAAFAGDDLVGFISGYFLPQKPNTLFVWQVAVDASQRGKGLARKMLQGLVTRHQSKIEFIETTITTDNAPSWSLFQSFARHNEVALNDSSFFDRIQHFNDQHDSERLVRLGPFSQ